MFSVMLSMTADTIKLSVSSSVFLLTRYETDFLALSMLSSRSALTSIAVFKSILTENVDDSIIEKKINNKTPLSEKTKYNIYKIRLTQIPTDKTSINPDSLPLMLMNLFLKNVISEPIITTGCIFVGSSPAITSIASETNSDSIINKNNSNESIFMEKISVINLLYSIIVYIIYNKKINNLLLNLNDDNMNIEEDVEKWLLDEDILREMKYDENADFHFIVEFPKENIMDVVKPKGKDCVIIACATQVAPQHQGMMRSADAKTNKDFIMDLNVGLNQFLVDFELQINQNILHQFVITEQIFEDGLTKDRLFTTLKRVFKAKLHCIWLIDINFVNADIAPQNENDMFV